MSSNIKVGDKVGYSKRFLQSTGQLTGDVPRARGIVTKIGTLGNMIPPADAAQIATIDWLPEFCDFPKRVAVGNLWKVGTNEDAYGLP